MKVLSAIIQLLQTVWTQFRPDNMSGLIWIQTLTLCWYIHERIFKLIMKKISRRQKILFVHPQLRSYGCQATYRLKSYNYPTDGRSWALDLQPLVYKVSGLSIIPQWLLQIFKKIPCMQNSKYTSSTKL